jgi:hypothetical protein
MTTWISSERYNGLPVSFVVVDGCGFLSRQVLGKLNRCAVADFVRDVRVSFHSTFWLPIIHKRDKPISNYSKLLFRVT